MNSGNTIQLLWPGCGTYRFSFHLISLCKIYSLLSRVPPWNKHSLDWDLGRPCHWRTFYLQVKICFNADEECVQPPMRTWSQKLVAMMTIWQLTFVLRCVLPARRQVFCQVVDMQGIECTFTRFGCSLHHQGQWPRTSTLLIVWVSATARIILRMCLYRSCGRNLICYEIMQAKNQPTHLRDIESSNVTLKWDKAW